MRRCRTCPGDSTRCMPRPGGRRFRRRNCSGRNSSRCCTRSASERLLMEEIDYSVLFRWFVGMNLDEPVWDVTVFTKNRDRLLDGDVARAFLCEVVNQAREKNLTSDEHFTVDGTLIEAWASLKSFQC